jgi:hypothetical protein
MPVSVEYMSNLIKEIPEKGLSDEDYKLVWSITWECWFALTPMLIRIIAKAQEESASRGQMKAFSNPFRKTFIVLRKSRVSCLDDCLSLLETLGVAFKYELLQNDTFPIEILISDVYFDKYKHENDFTNLNNLRSALIVNRSEEAAGILRQRLSKEVPGINTFSDEMVLSVAGFSV